MEVSKELSTPVALKDNPQMEYIPRSKPTKSYLQRKIEQYQNEAWGGEKAEIDFIPHIGKLERELRELKENKLAGAQFDEELEVKRLVDKMFQSFAPHLPPLGQSFVARKSKLEQEQEEFYNSLRKSGAEGEQMDTTLATNQVRNDSFGGIGLGDILKVHKSSLMKEQEYYRKQQENLEQENLDEPLLSQQKLNQTENAMTDIQGDVMEEVDDNQQDCSLMQMGGQQGDNCAPAFYTPMTPQVPRKQQYNLQQVARTVPVHRGNIQVNIDHHAQGYGSLVGVQIPEDECMEDDQMNVENEKPDNSKEETAAVLNSADGNQRSPQSKSKNKKEAATFSTPKRIMSPVDEALTELTKLQARTMEPRLHTPHYRYRTPSPRGSI
eukprot:TRINITY_DN7838_c0_g1_i3.p1 TRINITY_DN7838_c0_g1~~TRINITY_DN7838_c0_g1_i3.p1  ORF type:complete len:381 (-),score=62.82 TRINITY_DN7838_c0_g1_i3:351-1493(-)